jgi:hypothetical protein
VTGITALAYFYGLLNDTASSGDYMQSYLRVISQTRIEKDVEGNGHVLVSGTTSEFAWRCSAITLELSGEIVSIRAKV